jgi:hypothetical protein
MWIRIRNAVGSKQGIVTIAGAAVNATIGLAAALGAAAIISACGGGGVTVNNQTTQSQSNQNIPSATGNVAMTALQAAPQAQVEASTGPAIVPNLPNVPSASLNLCGISVSCFSRPTSGQLVEEREDAAGFAVAPEGTDLWAFVKVSFLTPQKYYAQLPPMASGSWNIGVGFGTANDSGKPFSLLLVAVPKGESGKLAGKTAEELGAGFPTLPESWKVLQEVAVQRR